MFVTSEQCSHDYSKHVNFDIFGVGSLRAQGHYRVKSCKNCVPERDLSIHLFRHFCRGMYYLATMHSITDRRTDRHADDIE